MHHLDNTITLAIHVLEGVAANTVTKTLTLSGRLEG